MLPSGPFATLLRYGETLRHLRRVQFTNRVTRKLPRPRANASPAPSPRERGGEWAAPVQRAVRLEGPTRITLLNQTGDFSGLGDWNAPSRPKLWLYNLHYFDWLAGPCADQAAAWNRGSIARWIHENPTGAGNGWEPYPLSLRVVNWIKWLLGGNAPVAGMLDSLAMQVRFLTPSLEHHLLGNHLLANAKALFFAGAFFGGDEGDGWLRKGEALLAAEWDGQILADGGHHERSPMYHALLLEDVLDSLNAARAFGLAGGAVGQRAPGLAERMLAWHSALTHPDGDIAMFNDAAFGIAASLAELSDYANRLGLRRRGETPGGTLRLLRSTGFVRAELGDAVLLADVGSVGPDHQPGHAHAETLSFELSLAGARAIVNCGVSTYELGPQRAWERGTAAHNCAIVRGLDSSDVWSAFRTGRRARVRDLEAGVSDDAIEITAAHDGYRFIQRKLLHRRRWKLHSRGLEMIDELEGARACEAEANFHLAVGLDIELAGLSGLVSGSRRPLRLTASSMPRRFASERATGFNRRAPAVSLALPFENGRAWVRWEW